MRKLIVAIAWVILLGMIASGIAWLRGAEWTAAGVWLAILVTMCLGLVVLAATRRPLFSFALATAIAAGLTAISVAKHQHMNVGLHAYDVAIYVNPATLSFLWSEYRSLVVGLLVGLIALAVGGIGLYLFDPGRIKRSFTLIALVPAIAVTAYAWQSAKSSRGFVAQFQAANYLSSFYLSVADAAKAIASGSILLDAGDVAKSAPFAPAGSCDHAVRRPNIILIHHESIFQPSLFPQIRYDPSLDGFFRGPDGKLRVLGVETYGGASWLAEFAILSGISARSFGDMRAFVQVFTAGKLQESLPQTLAKCGYRNIMIYPQVRNFVSNDRFFRSIGMNEIFDMGAQNAPSNRERDAFYYGSALSQLQRHFDGGEAPLFTYIETNASHAPYASKLAPELEVPGGDDGTNSPLIGEYLRRVAIAQLDLKAFVSELEQRFPEEAFVIVRYGDHQPRITAPYLGYAPGTTNSDVSPEQTPLAFHTFFTASAIRYVLPPVPDFPVLDIPYLYTVVLDAAGIPATGSQQARRGLMEACGGLYFACPDRGLVPEFHARLLRSNIVKP